MFSNRLPIKVHIWAYFRRVATELSHIPAWLEAMLVLFVVRIGFARLRYPALLQLLGQSAQKLRTSTSTPANSKDQVVSAVRRARHYGMGKFSCLEEALSIQWMLRRRNIEAQLRIGVRRTDDNQLLGHAWVEHAGEIVSIDLQSPASYVVLMPTTNGLPNESHCWHSSL